MVTRANTTTAAVRSIDEVSEQIFRSVEQSGALPPNLRAPEAVGATLCTLSRRLSGGEARDLAAALPPTIQAIVQPCATHRDEQPEVFSRREFLETLAEHLQIDTDQARAVSQAIFAAVEREIPMKEVTDIESQLPADLKELWGRHRVVGTSHAQQPAGMPMEEPPARASVDTPAPGALGGDTGVDRTAAASPGEVPAKGETAPHAAGLAPKAAPQRGEAGEEGAGAPGIAGASRTGTDREYEKEGRTMNCSELMKTDVACCKASEPVEQVAELMQARNIGFVPVCNDDGSVIGTLTDRDLAIRVLAEHRSASSTRAEDVMTREVVCCRPDEDLSVAERLMSEHKKSRIVCVDNQKHPLGVISLSDMADRDGGARSSQLLSSISQREARP
ncbi:CBS domain-containing protein [Sorangium sp. So ce1036]|uniref:CBS domain-containing protein n=1 Tax=Sorangium sp. So ce1036 TaxID=3133328 RepID=UPI003F04576C